MQLYLFIMMSMIITVFADQDDIWDENKLCVAINTIKSFTMFLHCMYQIKFLDRSRKHHKNI